MVRPVGVWTAVRSGPSLGPRRRVFLKAISSGAEARAPISGRKRLDSRRRWTQSRASCLKPVLMATRKSEFDVGRKVALTFVPYSHAERPVRSDSYARPLVTEPVLARSVATQLHLLRSAGKSSRPCLGEHRESVVATPSATIHDEAPLASR